MCVNRPDTFFSITFFATPDSALRRPHRRHGKFGIVDTTSMTSLVQTYDLSDAIHLLDELSINNYDNSDKKKFLKKIIHAILSYHILPSKLDVAALANNNTFATTLVLPGSLGARPLRVRVTQGLISSTRIINFFSEVNRPDVAARNGWCHQISFMSDMLNIT